MRTYTYLFVFLSLFLLVSSCKESEPAPEPPNSKFTLEYLGSGKVRTRVEGIINSAFTYTWTFGDGSSYNGTDVTHTYKQNGTYNITLVVSGADRQSSTAKAALVDNIATTGQGIVYLYRINNVKGNVAVTVNGTSEGSITIYDGTRIPNCGDAGYATFTRPAGTYNISAKAQSGESWVATMTIMNGQCSKLGLQ
ncbi:hypothetical protein BWI97_14405 [Siphonobacter sp. BAB-5405]|nr:hypothetical protein BWI97_14405 [Siphonobacter sp. BAB-5405]